MRNDSEVPSPLIDSLIILQYLLCFKFKYFCTVFKFGFIVIVMDRKMSQKCKSFLITYFIIVMTVELNTVHYLFIHS